VNRHKRDPRIYVARSVSSWTLGLEGYAGRVYVWFFKRALIIDFRKKVNR
jgi:hypothetical protein